MSVVALGVNTAIDLVVVGTFSGFCFEIVEGGNREFKTQDSKKQSLTKGCETRKRCEISGRVYVAEVGEHANFQIT
jgi:hypothetical protein